MSVTDVPTTAAVPAARTDLWWRWVVTVSSAELVGFVVPALTATVTRHAPGNAQLLTLVAAGAAEGALLGLGQARVLRTVLPGLSVREWVSVTSAAAAVAWLLGMLPSATREVWSTWPVGFALVAGAVTGTALLLTLGLAQAAVLADHVAHPTRWIAWTALGWAVGLTTFLGIATPLWHEGQAAWVVVSIGLGAGLLMAASMAAVTGAGIVRLTARRSPAHGPGAPTHR